MGMQGEFGPAVNPGMGFNMQVDTHGMGHHPHEHHHEHGHMSGPMPGPMYSPPPLQSDSHASATSCVGGYDPSGTSFNDYTSFVMDHVKQGKQVLISDMEVWMNEQKDRVTYIEIKYEVPNGRGVFTVNEEKHHGTKPGSFMYPHESKHFFSGDFITNITGRHDGTKITKLCIKSNKGTAIEIGKDIGTEFNLMVPTGKRVISLATQFTSHMTNIGAYYA